jgi:hypothetical protein
MLQSQLTVENVAELLLLHQTFKEPNHTEMLLRFITTHVRAVTKTKNWGKMARVMPGQIGVIVRKLAGVVATPSSKPTTTPSRVGQLRSATASGTCGRVGASSRSHIPSRLSRCNRAMPYVRRPDPAATAYPALVEEEAGAGGLMTSAPSSARAPPVPTSSLAPSYRRYRPIGDGVRSGGGGGSHPSSERATAVSSSLSHLGLSLAASSDAPAGKENGRRVALSPTTQNAREIAALGLTSLMPA